MDAATADVLQTAARQIHDCARSHKQAAEYHRRQMREQMAALDRLRQLCTQHGITLTLQGEGERSHGHGRTVQPEDPRRA